MPEALRSNGALSLPDVPYDALVEQAIAGVYLLQDEVCVYCNRTWAAILGYPLDEVIGSDLARFAAPSFLPELRRLYYKRLESDPPSLHFVTHLVHRDGHDLHIEVHGSRIVYRGRPAVMGVAVDITERLRAEDEVRRSREQLRELSAYVGRKLDEQRLAFARDVHDELGGMLTSLKMDATRVLRRVEGAELRELTAGLIDLTQRTIDAVKQISERLRPSELDHLGLEVVIARTLEKFGARHGIACTFDPAVPGQRLSPRRAHAIYRIFDEMLTNVARHAGASRVEVRLALVDDDLVLDLRDDGVGFDPARPGNSALGLLSMSERAREIGAELAIESAPNAGTSLRLSAPLL